MATQNPDESKNEAPKRQRKRGDVMSTPSFILKLYNILAVSPDLF